MPEKCDEFSIFSGFSGGFGVIVGPTGGFLFGFLLFLFVQKLIYKGEEKDSIKKTTSSKAILVDGQLFPSLRAAADFLGVKDTSPLCKALKANKKYKGHICEYANQQPSISLNGL